MRHMLVEKKGCLHIPASALDLWSAVNCAEEAHYNIQNKNQRSSAIELGERVVGKDRNSAYLTAIINWLEKKALPRRYINNLDKIFCSLQHENLGDQISMKILNEKRCGQNRFLGYNWHAVLHKKIPS